MTAVSLTFRIATKFHNTIATAGATAQIGNHSGFAIETDSQITAPSRTQASVSLRAAVFPTTEAKVRFPPARSLSSSDKPLATPLARLSTEKPRTKYPA